MLYEVITIDDLQEILDRNFDGQLEFEPEFLDEIKAEKIRVRLRITSYNVCYTKL